MRAPCSGHHAGIEAPALTDTDVLVVQLGGRVAEEAQTAVLAVLAPGVVFATDAGHYLQVFNVTAAVGVAVAFTV